MKQRVYPVSVILTALCATVVLFASCGRDDEGAASEGAGDTVDPSTVTAPAPNREQAEPATQANTAEAKVDDAPALDPGKLKTIMVDLGQQMERVQMAVWLEDFQALSASALAVANHPSVSAEERGRIQDALNDEFSAFVMTDREVHNAATRLSDAALARDIDTAVKELALVQSSCVSCHTRFRKKLRP